MCCQIQSKGNVIINCFHIFRKTDYRLQPFLIHALAMLEQPVATQLALVI